MVSADKRSREKSLLIIEPHFDGHRGGYVTWIAEAAIERGYHVTLATLSSTTSDPLWAPLNELPSEKFESILLENESIAKNRGGAFGLIVNEFRNWRLFQQFFKNCSQISSVDIVIVPYLDYCANAIACIGSPFGRTSWCGIVMRQAFHSAPMGVHVPASVILPAKKHLFLRLLRNKTLKKLFTIDETLVSYVLQTRPKKSTRLSLLLDPADTKGEVSQVEARRSLGLPADSVVMLVYGYMDLRKGIDTVLEMLKMGDISERLHVVFAGKHGEISERLFAHPDNQVLIRSGRVHVINKFLNDNEEYAVFKAASIVWLGYRGHYGMSGVIVQAGQMRRPIIACRVGLIGWMTRTYELGILVDINSPDEILNAINELTEHFTFSDKCGENGFRKFSRHTVIAFGNTIFDSVSNGEN